MWRWLNLSPQLGPAVPLPAEPAGAALQDAGRIPASDSSTPPAPGWKRKQFLATCPWGGALATWGGLAELRAACRVSLDSELAPENHRLGLGSRPWLGEGMA